MSTEIELVKSTLGAVGRGDASARSTRLRTPAMSGSKDVIDRLKSTRHATPHRHQHPSLT